MSMRGARTCSLRLSKAALPNQHRLPRIESALVTGGTKVCRAIVPLPAPVSSESDFQTCLTQGLGLEYCRSLANQGCKLLVMTSRSGVLDPADQELFQAKGMEIHVLKVDSSDAASMRRLLSWVHETLAPIQHFAHAAGVAGLSMLQDLSYADFSSVVDTKVIYFGAVCVNSHIDSRGQRYDERIPSVIQVVGMDAFEQAMLPVTSQLLFSSTSSVWAQTGSAHYSAANSYLDGIAARRHHQGLPSTAIQFGPFGDAGMAASHADELAALGLRSLKPHQVWEAFVAAGAGSQMIYARIEVSRFTRIYSAKGRWSLLDHLSDTAGLLPAQRGGRVSPDATIRAPPSMSRPAFDLEQIMQLVKISASDILGEELQGRMAARRKSR